MKAYPLLFTYCNAARGEDYVAGVITRGRAIMRDEDGVWWMTGINPGGLAACGLTPMEASKAFERAFQQTLHDLASSLKTIVEFESEVHRLVESVDADAERVFVESRAAIRANAAEIGPGFANLRKESNEEPRGVTVVDISAQFPEQVENAFSVAA